MSRTPIAWMFAVGTALSAMPPARAQHAGHEAHAPASATQAPPTDAPSTGPASMDHASMDHASMDHASMDHASMDHSSMDHSSMDHPSMDHSTMDHSSMDHSSMEAAQEPLSPRERGWGEGRHVEHSTGARGARSVPTPASSGTPRTLIPALTDADRRAAFPQLARGHAHHGEAVHSCWLADRLEWQDADEGAAAWEALAWIGTDTRRLWLRTEGEHADGRVESAYLEALYGRSTGPWWDALVGVRHDSGEGPDRTWLAVGVQGLAPYKFETSATAYVGSAGRTALMLESEYDTLLSNRWILQWRAEAELHGRDDPARGIGRGLSSIEAGARLRYEVTRRFAPYVGIEWHRAFGRTADLHRADDEPVSETRAVAGVRMWF